MKKIIVPFLTPALETVSHGGWRLVTPEGDVPLPGEMDHWDYQTTLGLKAPVSIKRRLVTRECHIEYDSAIDLLVMAHSSHTNARFLVHQLPVPVEDVFDLAVEVSLDGAELGGRLSLETLLVVTEPKPLGPLAPQHPGSIIWRDKQWTELEGTHAQFPTDSTDFGKVGLDQRAGWQLKIDLTDPEARFLSAARLTLNTGDALIQSLLSGAKDDKIEQLLRTLNWDVTRQMVQVALASDEVISREVDPDAATVAGVLRNLLSRIWPLEDPATLRRWQLDDPSRIEVRLQQEGGLLSS